MSQAALSRTTGKPGIGGSRAVLTTPLLPTGRTSRPRGTMTVIVPMWVWTTISTSQSSNSANHRGEVSLGVGPEQCIEGCLKAVEIHLPAGQESLQEVGPALLEVLRDRGSVSAGPSSTQQTIGGR
jgi:hypothetical protein